LPGPSSVFRVYTLPVRGGKTIGAHRELPVKETK
jgi:hypothetical protein